jgi:hypothetical protein
MEAYELRYETPSWQEDDGDFNFDTSEALYDICLWIGGYCLHNSFDVHEVLMQRWETISKRNFIENPLTGGREAEV